jgi:hypothetical protein
LIKAIERREGGTANIPKCIETLIQGFCGEMESCGKVQTWKGDFLNQYLSEDVKAHMTRGGIKWKRPKGYFVSIESAIAQMLLRIKSTDFDCHVGPCFKLDDDRKAVRVFGSFGSSSYATDIQKELNKYFGHSKVLPLVLSIAVWVDKAPLNASGTRNATPLVIMLMNDKTRTPYRVGYAPDDPMNEEELIKLIKSQNISQAAGNIEEIMKEFKRQTLIDFTTSVIQEFTKHIVSVEYMDIQVGVGDCKAYYRVVPLISHFMTDNVQAFEISGVNKENCRICVCTKKDFSRIVGLQHGVSSSGMRDWKHHRFVCQRYSELTTLRLKNIADGHNRTFLSADVQIEIDAIAEEKKSLGCLPCNNKIFDLPHPLTIPTGIIKCCCRPFILLLLR